MNGLQLDAPYDFVSPAAFSAHIKIFRRCIKVDIGFVHNEFPDIGPDDMFLLCQVIAAVLVQTICTRKLAHNKPSNHYHMEPSSS